MKILSWEEETRIIESVRQLEHLLAEIGLEASRIGVPIAVGLDFDDRLALLMVVGHEKSHLEFYSETARPPIVASRGGNDADEHISFLYYGEPSEVSCQSCIPYADALNAMIEFYLTGERPPSIQWSTNDADT